MKFSIILKFQQKILLTKRLIQKNGRKNLTTINWVKISLRRKIIQKQFPAAGFLKTEITNNHTFWLNRIDLTADSRLWLTASYWILRFPIGFRIHEEAVFIPSHTLIVLCFKLKVKFE